MLNSIGDAIFQYMPIILGFTAAKKFKLKPFVGMLIGAALCYPGIQLATLSASSEPLYTLFAGTMIESPVYITFLGLPVIAMDYTSTVVPVILIVYLASKLEKMFDKIIPDVVKNFFVPMAVLLVSLPIGFMLVGPIATFGANMVGHGFLSLYNFSPILCCVLVGLFWQALVIFGLHWGLIPIAISNMMTMGFDTILVGAFAPSFAQTAVVAAMYFKLKDKKIKELCIPAVISGICGVTEPAIYGITLPRKKPFIYSCIGGAAAGAVMGVMNIKGYVMGGLGIFGIPNYINPATGDMTGVYTSIVAAIVAAIVGFVLTFLLWKDDTVVEESNDNKEQSTIVKTKREIIYSPIKGEEKALDQVQDAAFSSGVLGQGVAIVPKEGKVVAPFDGTVMTLFPTKHAIGIVSDNGCELLVHIGLNTVQLDGKYFKSFVKQGDKIKKGQTLVTFDIEKISKEGYCLETPVVVTNYSDYVDVVGKTPKNINNSQELITVLKSNDNKEQSTIAKTKREVIYSPIKGEVKVLDQVQDAAFSSGVLGKGVAIIPKEGKVVAPFDGTVMTLFPTKHAIGIVSDNGCELLIHIGLNTVQLDGKYFESFVKQGDKIKKGQTLLTFDIDKISKEGYCLETPVVVTNYSDYVEIVEKTPKDINNNQELITVLA